jgi:peptidoglycan/LPS O-acetylase OafA/YrhL
LFVIGALIACVVGALLCYRLVERRLTQGLKKYWTRPAERAPAA